MSSRASRMAYVRPGTARLQVVAGADAGDARTDDQHVEVFARHGATGSSYTPMARAGHLRAEPHERRNGPARDARTPLMVGRRTPRTPMRSTYRVLYEPPMRTSIRRSTLLILPLIALAVPAGNGGSRPERQSARLRRARSAERQHRGDGEGRRPGAEVQGEGPRSLASDHLRLHLRHGVHERRRGCVRNRGRQREGSGTVELPLVTCSGFIPFFNTPTTGKCVPSALP